MLRVLLPAAALLVSGCYAPYVSRQLAPVGERVLVKNPGKTICAETASIVDGRIFKLPAPAINEGDQKANVTGLRRHLETVLTKRAGATVASTCGEKNDVRILFDHLAFHVTTTHVAENSGTPMFVEAQLVARVYDRQRNAWSIVRKKTDAFDFPSGNPVLMGFVASEQTTRLTEALLEDLGFRFEPAGFTGVVGWHAWRPKAPIDTPGREGPAAPATREDVQRRKGRPMGEIYITAFRETFDDLPDASALYPRVGRAAAALGGTHFVVKRYAASTTASTFLLVDPSKSVSRVDAVVEVFDMSSSDRSLAAAGP